MLAKFSTIIMKDFNINMLANTLESIMLQYYMNKYSLKIYTKSKTPNNTQMSTWMFHCKVGVKVN